MSAAIQLPPKEQGIRTLVASFVPIALITPVLITRLYIRWRRQALGPDDALMLACWLLYFIGNVLLAISTDSLDIRHQPTVLAAKLLWANQPFTFVALVVGKTSIAIFMIRILDRVSTLRKWLLWSHAIVYAILAIITIGLCFGQCNPTRALWEPQLTLEGKAKCLNPRVYDDISILFNAFGAYLDLFLAVFPVSFVWKLENWSLAKRVTLIVLLSLSLFTGICAIIKTVLYVRLYASPTPFISFDVFLWSNLELALLIFIGSLPGAKPFWDYATTGKSITASGSGSGSRRPFWVRMQKRSKTGHSSADSSAETPLESFHKNNGKVVAHKVYYPMASDGAVSAETFGRHGEHAAMHMPRSQV